MLKAKERQRKKEIKDERKKKPAILYFHEGTDLILYSEMR